jgi:putative cell wall-binding protein
MQRMSLRTRAVAGLTSLALAGGLFMVAAPSAQAALGDATVTTTNPFLQVSVANQTYGTITVKEKTGSPGIFPDNTDVCITFDGANVKFNTTGTAPAVADDNATATVATPATFTTATNPDDTIKFKVTKASATTAATYTITGARVDVGAAPKGPVTAKAGVCGGLFETDIVAGYVGNVSRLAGSTRYATAQQIADSPAFDPCVNGADVVVARGDNFPDALAASFLAGKLSSAILLTGSTSLPNETIAALKTSGAINVTLIGGTEAISTGVENVLRGTPAYQCNGTPTGSNLTVARAYGENRYATARTVALQGGTAGTLSTDCTTPVKTAIVASGENFPDALAAGGLAYRGSITGGACGTGSLPLLLTQKSTLPADTSNTLSDLGIKQVILLGGTGAVAANVETALDNVSGVDDVTRVSGPTRQDTAVEVSQLLQAIGYGPATFLVSRPDAFPDALAAGPLAGILGSPLFLTESTTALGSVAKAGITAFPGSPFFTDAIVLGGTGALSDAVFAQVGAAIAAQAN